MFRLCHKMPGQIFQLFLKGLEGKTTILRIDEDASIADLKKMVHEKTLISLDEMRLLYCSKELRETDENNKKQFLSDYHIQDEGNLVLVLRLRGGSQDEEIPTPKVLGPDIELTSEPDMITFDDDKDGQRAKMPCGHAIGPESLTAYCRSLLSSGKYEFRCPHVDPRCGQLWEFYTVRRLAVLTKAEQKEFENKISTNYLTKALGIQECPKCQSYCERQNRKDIRVICPVCSKKNQNRLYEFCWFCLRTWLTSNAQECGNLNCTGEDPRKKILREAPKKTVVGVAGCPSVRACPKCGLMIEHTEACKHMACPCGQKFCFICLKKVDSTGNFQCGAHNFKCDIAPIQTELS